MANKPALSDTYRGLTNPEFLRYRTKRLKDMIWRDLMLQRARSRCGICGEVIYGDFQIDHILPRAGGGTDEIENLQCVHPRCNASKGSMGERYWITEEAERIASLGRA